MHMYIYMYVESATGSLYPMCGSEVIAQAVAVKPEQIAGFDRKPVTLGQLGGVGVEFVGVAIG